MAGVAVPDELAIRNLVARYADAASQRDTQTWAQTWAVDGVWDLGRATARGRDEILAVLQAGYDRHAYLLQMMTSGEVFTEGTDVRGVWYVLEVQGDENGSQRLVAGRYDDIYRVEDGHWVFAKRRFQRTYRGAPSDGEADRL